MPHEKTINPRNPKAARRVAGHVTGPGAYRGAAMVALVLLLLSVAAPALAHGRVFVGGVFAFPAPYAPYYGPYSWSWYPAPVPWATYPTPLPPGWVAGRWERRYDQSGRPYQAWVPPHLQ
jgi:hypothetical protein